MPSTIRRALLFLLLGIGGFLVAASAVSQSQATPEIRLERAIAALESGRFGDAVTLLQPLADAGMPRAQTELGVLYHLGRGVAEDDGRAYALFGRAAAQGEAAAMFWLGRMYLLGHGPPREAVDADRDAARWFFEGARRGHAESQYYLGMLFFAGTGVERNRDEAHKWFERAAASGHDGARAFVTQAPGR